MSRAGQTFIVTGGASGLGLGTVKLLANEGANVMILDRNADLGNETAKTVGTTVAFTEVDVTDEESVKKAVASTVAKFGRLDGVINCAGIGSAMAANKVPGIRAALCYDHSSAVNSREHNDANVLTLGAGLIGPNLAKHIVQTWLATPFAGGRHQKRVDKIVEIEQRFLKDRP